MAFWIPPLHVQIELNTNKFFIKAKNRPDSLAMLIKTSKTPALIVNRILVSNFQRATNIQKITLKALHFVTRVHRESETEIL